jgi:hypothetical protein
MAAEYCQLVGSLGLSPYEEHPDIDDILNRVYERLDPGIVRDLCNAADEKTFSSLAELVIGVAESLDSGQEARLAELLAVGLPPDQAPHAWQWGRQAADRVRREFHISNADPQGGQRFLATLGLDSVTSVGAGFAAARAAFLGWAHAVDDSHLLTTAITRDQQASRAFAAEMLAPAGYIRTRAANRVLSDHAVREIAQALNAPAGAVSYQARHARIHVVGASGWG